MSEFLQDVNAVYEQASSESKQLSDAIDQKLNETKNLSEVAFRVKIKHIMNVKKDAEMLDYLLKYFKDVLDEAAKTNSNSLDKEKLLRSFLMLELLLKQNSKTSLDTTKLSFLIEKFTSMDSYLESLTQEAAKLIKYVYPTAVASLIAKVASISTSTTIQPSGISINPYTIEEVLEQIKKSNFVSDDKLVETIGVTVDSFEILIHNHLDLLEQQNKVRTSLRALLNKVNSMPSNFPDISQDSDLLALFEKVKEKCSWDGHGWTTADSQRLIASEIINAISEGAQETKLVYSRMSQDVSRRSEFVKIFGHIINSMLDCETKFMKNMRW